MEQFFHTLWYNRKLRYLAYLLTPLSLLYWIGIKINTYWNKKQREYFNVPIIVVGNLIVGGAGKTPVLITLTQALQQEGFSVGVVSRGYKSLAEYGPKPVLISLQHTAAEVGDEPLLIFKKTKAPVVVHANRNQAIHTLLANVPELDIILSDDGLQNAKLSRDLEIIVIGKQGFGNGLLLPAGPLREPTKRLEHVDFCIENGKNFQFLPQNTPNVNDKIIHAVTGIAHPQHFFQTLRDLGFNVIPHVFPDHHAFLPSDFHDMDDHPIIITEKDAVKCCKFNLKNVHVLVMDGHVDPQLLHDFLAKVRYTIKQKKTSMVQLSLRK